MKGQYLSVALLVATAMLLLIASSCAHNTHLVSINIQPGNGTFSVVDPSAFFQYRAYGTYIHPPKTVDITTQATWQSDNPEVARFTAPGVVSPNTNCGVAQIFATLHDSPNDIVSNEVSITVDGPASLGCPQGTGSGTNTLSVNITAGVNDGVILSSVPGILCPTACAASFPTGTKLSLSATPNPGHNFLGWGLGSCDTQSGMNCTLTMNTDRTVNASFD